ncbi:MAG: type 4a pilus biogenesis protein PilO [Succinivibrionaceae bacterium]|nr:type 4a pilus biogenesis protein PilO [Succinivibrionaceae bacterium]
MAASIDFNNLNFHNPGSLPLPVKLLMMVVVFILILLVAAYFIAYTDDSLMDQLDSAQQKEEQLKKEFSEKAQRANNIEAYEEQKRKLQSMIQDQLKMLPNSNEVAQLLSDISKTATDNGLKIEKIEWAPEVRREMYTELPMNIVIVGDYDKIGNFTADVANLNRIVVIEEFIIDHYSNNSENLKMTMVAKTYRYNSDNGKPAAPKGGRK